MNEFLQLLHNRNSAPRLTAPAPSEAEMQDAFLAAARAPDHAWLRPWRFITIDGDRRTDFGDVLAANLLLRNPQAESSAVERARKAPLRAPLLLVVVAKLSEHPKVPHSEQRLSSGCAAQAILLACEAMGYAGIWRTGASAFDRKVMAALGLEAAEEITGFLYLGTREGPSKKVPRFDQDRYVSSW
ncbi:MAG: nitroreductase [Halioglobus sp.]|jgi:nitroreductase